MKLLSMSPGISATRPPASIGLHIETMGGLRVWRDGTEIPASAWGREKALALFEFFITMRRRPLQKEAIIDRLWPELDADAGDRDFRVALNALQKALEPERGRRGESRFIRREGLTYALDMSAAQVDADEFEALLAQAHTHYAQDTLRAIETYKQAVALYRGDYLPDRLYADWTSAERERVQTLALGAITRLANLLLTRDTLESMRLARRVLAIEPAWEDAYRVEMRAHLAQGNPAMAVKTYRQCERVLREEFGLEPLPETRGLVEALL